MADEYYTETLKNWIKVCPRTGTDALYNECYCNDCSDVLESEGVFVHGILCVCAHDIAEANREYDKYKEKEQQKINRETKMKEGLCAARKIDYNDFVDYCKALDKSLLANAMKFDKDLVIRPYIDDDKQRAMYLMKDGVPESIIFTENMLNTLNSWKAKLTEPNGEYTFSFADVPKAISSAVRVNIYLRYNMDVCKILGFDNPVYVSSKMLGKYIDALYGWKWYDFKKARQRHLELTEITNYNVILYVKSEVDEMVRRETMLKEEYMA